MFRQLNEVCRRHGISTATFYKWKSKYGGLEISDAKRLKGLEDENRRLKRLLADSLLDIYREERLMVRRRRERKRALGTRAPMILPGRINQRWSLDFVSDTLSDGRRFRILCIVDDYSRECLAAVVEVACAWCVS